MDKNNILQSSYTYKPEPVNQNVTDWATFTEPDIFVIERILADGSQITCKTKIISSSLRGNAWSSGDIREAIFKESVQKILKSEINLARLDTVLDNEGKALPFIFKWRDKTLTILPPDNEDTETLKAGKDIAGLVYVLSKVYKQQLNREECESLKKSE